jgi:hypothetical protein
MDIFLLGFRHFQVGRDSFLPFFRYEFSGTSAAEDGRMKIPVGGS